MILEHLKTCRGGLENIQIRWPISFMSPLKGYKTAYVNVRR